MIISKRAKKDIKNIVKFYKILQQDYLILSDEETVIVMAYKEKGEPAWLTKLVLEKDIERAARLT